jgi:glycosyltransferase involved in cell wall biosynthesis
MSNTHDLPLKICLLTYRGNPHCGGQGVYVKYLSKAITELGHRVDVVSGPPHPILNSGINNIRLPSLDLYNPDHLFRKPTLSELLDPINLLEWLSVTTMGFPEPYTFGKRVCKFLLKRIDRYDIVHDNQSLSYGIEKISRQIPTVATIHHPITIDRDISIKSTTSFFKKLQHLRWYSFIGMQKRVSKKLDRIITVSKRTRKDIGKAFSIPVDQLKVVFNGIDARQFKPMPEVSREPFRIITTNSADTPLKGLKYLLRAIARLSERQKIRLVVIGEPQKNGISKSIKNLSLEEIVTFTGRISHTDLVMQYARASVAVVPSVYEGFGFPAGEAMACGLPVVSTSGGALPELIGDAGIMVPPEDADALSWALWDLLQNRAMAASFGIAGMNRVKRMFAWENTAKNTVAVYREAIREYRRFK